MNNKKKPLILAIFFTAFLVVGALWYAKIPETTDEVSGDPPATNFDFNGKNIETIYTDDNTGEDLIIRTDRETYSGWSELTSYFSIENTSSSTQDVDIQFYFNGTETIGTVSELKKNQPYNVTVNDYGERDDTCKQDWVASTSEDGTEGYVCVENFDVCDSVNGTICTKNYAFTGTHEETKYRDEWGTMSLAPSIAIDETIPKGFSPSNKTTYSIPSNGIRFFRGVINVPPKGGSKFWIVAKGDKGGRGVLDPWYSSSWTYRKPITVEADLVTTTTDDLEFPILATTTDADLKHSNNGGKVEIVTGDDIIFVDGDDTTLLNYEQEFYASTTGQIIYHIQDLLSSTTDQTIYMYYGNSGAGDQATSTGVWNDLPNDESNYRAIWHFANATTASTTDSTKNGNDGYTNQTSASTTADGYIGTAFRFESASGGEIMFDDDTSLQNLFRGPMTFSWWAQIDTQSSADEYFYKGSYRYIDATSNLDDDIRMYSDYGTSGNNYAHFDDMNYVGGWRHLTIVYLGGDNTNDDKMFFYWDGVPQASTAHSGTAAVQNQSDAGTNFQIGDIINASFDEVRLSAVARDAQWIETEYNNQSNMTTFLTFGAEETETPAAAEGNPTIQIKGGRMQVKGGILQTK